MTDQASEPPASVPDLVTVRSASSVTETMARLEGLVKAKGMRVFARIEFTADAARDGLTMRPMAQLVFGNPKGGTPLLVAAPTTGIDLPLRVLVWEDAGGATWLSYNDPEALGRRHHLPAQLAGNIAGIRGLAAAAAQGG